MAVNGTPSLPLSQAACQLLYIVPGSPRPSSLVSIKLSILNLNRREGFEPSAASERLD
jgi:hypothetical protein